MMFKRSRAVVVAATVLATSAALRADPAQDLRCTADNLEVAEAVQRLEWARKCGLLLNAGGPGNWFASDYDSASGGSAQEYQENNGNRAYTGISNSHYINQEYTWRLYPGAGTYTTFQETTGPTAGFWKWSRPAQRPHPQYPTFETSPSPGAGIPLVPLPTIWGDCNLYQWDRAAGTLTPWTGSFYVVGYCESSCYTPDQSLRFGDGDVNIVEAMKQNRDDLITLTADATLDDLATQTARVLSYTTEIRDAENVIYKLTMASGGSLRVTNEHPIITSVGRLVQAQKLAVGDQLVKADGTPDAILRIEKSTHFGKVYNIKPVSTAPVANILIAQGYLVGSARFQNDDLGYVNRILLFRGVPDDVIPQ